MSMAPEAELVARKVIAARCAEDVFGEKTSASGVLAAFRSMARILHPDRAGPERAAADAMAKLLELRDEADRKFKLGTWGDKAPAKAVEIRTKRVYKNVRPLAAGDLYDVYLADYEDGKARRAVLKLLRDQHDNDLAAAEWSRLEQLWGAKDVDAKTFQRYLPRQVETARIEIGGKHRRANIFRYAEDSNTLAEVLVARPAGLDPRDMAWMWRRMLEALSWIHARGVVHGAILPEHVLVRPKDHGAKLVGWSCSVPTGEKIKAISAGREGWYPPEVKLKLGATPATDIYMSAKLAEALIGSQAMPPKIEALISACLIPNPRIRYDNAVDVYRRFDEVLRDLYGPPTFRPFTLTP